MTSAFRAGPGAMKSLLGSRSGFAITTRGAPLRIASACTASGWTAARNWNGHPEFMPLPDAIEGSYEQMFHATELERFVVSTAQARSSLAVPRFERAVGVVYQPDGGDGREYFRASMADQFDAIVH